MRIAGFLLGLLLSQSAAAVLVDRGNGLIYDTALNITWTQDAGMADGDWDSINSWANNLVYGGYDDWRLPWASVANQSFAVAVDLCTTEASCRDNELAHMANYGIGTGGAIITGVGGRYWSGTKRVSGSIWYYNFDGGPQNFEAGGVSLNGWAVRDGDVSPIPEPSQYVLMALGLAALGWRVKSSMQSS